MDSILNWLVLGVGIVGILFAVVVGFKREHSENGEYRAAGFAVLGAVILFLATIPSEPPVFALGMRLGFGILIGGLLGALAGLLAARAGDETSWARSIRACGIASISLVGIGLVMTFFGSYPQPALGGFMIGAVVSAVVFRIGLVENANSDVWILSSISVGAATLLATYRFNTPDVRFWWMTPSLILAAAIVSAIAFAGISKEDGRFGPHMLAASALTLVLTTIFAWRLFPDWALLWTAIVGIVTLALAAWLANLERPSIQASAACAIMILAFSALAFKFLGGFGIGIGILAGFAILLPVVSSFIATSNMVRMLNYALYIGVGILLLRLFLEVHQYDLRGPDLRAYYTFIAITLGAILPFMLASLASGSRMRLAGTWVCGFLAAASPISVIVLWGMKAGLGFLIGALVSQIIVLLLNADITDRARSSYAKTSVLVTAAQISAVQLAWVADLFSESMRLIKVAIIFGLVALGVIWAFVLQFINRSRDVEA